jgi:hypothetical protein
MFEARSHAASLAVLANSHHERERPIESDVWDRSIAVLQVLVNSKKWHRFPTVSSPEQIAWDTAISSIMNFSGTAPAFRCTKPRREKAMTLLDDRANGTDSIAPQFRSTLHDFTNFRPQPHPDI